MDFSFVPADIRKHAATPDVTLARRPRSPAAAHRHRVHDMLRAPDRLGALHVRTHVHVLRVRPAAVARQGRRPLPAVPGRHPGRDPHVQVVSRNQAQLDLVHIFVIFTPWLVSSLGQALSFVC